MTGEQTSLIDFNTDAANNNTSMCSKKPVLMKVSKFDKFQTPDRALDYLCPFIQKDTTIWEPACGKGNLVRGFSKRGYNVFGSDIERQTDDIDVEIGDFLIQETRHPYGVLVTNPPFSIKTAFLQRCYELKKPFALLLPLTVFDSQKRRKAMREHGVQMIVPDERFSFETPNHEENMAAGKKTGGAWFCTAWFCWGLDLPSQIVLPEMPRD